MAVVRILIDGYSLLHQWKELAPGRPRYSAAARDVLIEHLRQYQDAIGTPLTLIFDGTNAPSQPSTAPSSCREFEILYSSLGQTADELIERTTARLREYGEVSVVTDDFAEQDTISSLGGFPVGCEHFIREVEETLRQLRRDVKARNREERRQFRRP